MNESSLESGFKINNILLMESSFKREVFVTFNNPEVKPNIDVATNVNVKDNTIYVTVQVTYTQHYADILEVSCIIKMAGVFEKIGNATLDLEEFGHVNGAAIIFPYIREHLTNLSAKAGLGLIILPPINLTKKG